jgi:glyoxylase-like metal-dependent hydrolase (beta-lactamase superfamily II)
LKITRDIFLVGDGETRISDRRDSHVYLVDGGDTLALIDSGAGLATRMILDNIGAEGFKLKRINYLIITHSHADHACGASEIREATGCKVLAPTIEAEVLEKGGQDLEYGLTAGKKSGIYPEDYQYKFCEVDIVLKDNDVIKLGKYQLRVLQVPGHSHGIICILTEGGPTRSIFTSDVVFHGGTIGLGNWAGSSLTSYRANIGKLANLGVEAMFPGHFLWTLRGGQEFLDRAIDNLKGAWVPPAWQHNHPHF